MLTMKVLKQKIAMAEYLQWVVKTSKALAAISICQIKIKTKKRAALGSQVPQIFFINLR